MTRPSPRWRLRSLLMATAVVAATLGVARPSLEPYPPEWEDYGGPQVVYWSGDTVSMLVNRTILEVTSNYGPIVRVDWSDGTPITHIRRPDR